MIGSQIREVPMILVHKNGSKCEKSECKCTKFEEGKPFDSQAQALPWNPNPQPTMRTDLECKRAPICCCYCLSVSSSPLNDYKNCDISSWAMIRHDPLFKDVKGYCLSQRDPKQKLWKDKDIPELEGMWPYIVIYDYLRFYFKHHETILLEYKKHGRDITLATDFLVDITHFRNWVEDIIEAFGEGLPCSVDKIFIFLNQYFRFTTCRRSHPVLVLKQAATPCRPNCSAPKPPTQASKPLIVSPELLKDIKK